MKIIQQGNMKLIKPAIRFKCDRCDCIYECESGEYAIKNGGRNDDYYVAKCPTCGNEVWVYK